MQLPDWAHMFVIKIQLAGVPTPSPTLPTGTDTDVQTLVNWGAGIAAIACLFGLLGVGGKMAMASRHNEEFNAGQLGKPLIGGVIVSSAALIINAIIG